MAADISNLNYGRSSVGISTLKTNFEKDINKALKALKDDDANYKKLRTLIKNNWSGTDASKYLSLLDQQRQALYNRYKEYKHCICNALDADMKAFEKDQSTNATKISSSINIK